MKSSSDQPVEKEKAKRRRLTRKSPPKVDDLPGAEAPLTRYEAFTTARVDRRLIKEATYNPRVIAPDAAERLERAVKRGLVQPIVWNRRTGNLIGGHQRLARIDELEGTKPFSLTVAVVDCDEVEEKRLNVELNNPDLMGQFDVPRLEGVLRDIKSADPSADLLLEVGFSAQSLEGMLIAPELYLAPEVSADVRAILDDADKINQIKGVKNEHKKSARLAAHREALRQVVFVVPDKDYALELRRKILVRIGVPADSEEVFFSAVALCRALDIEVPSDASDEEEA
ncbi:MAG: hypothetical protein E6Q97_20225 [Desulfurellales bacterium]|nr:MAG: hypothetical protein E6Q97_20225 [Desulfurellales bacterium]